MGDSPDIFGHDPDEIGAPTADELEAAGQSALFGMSEPAPQPAPRAAPTADVGPTAAQPYRVLARKYRPQTFAQLIGQDAMVQTLANGIKRERLAHAFLMTGVRGVGKTSTARLIAKALNCVGPDGAGGPTIDPCGACEPCVAIAEGRHIDVIEMDAASHTGVDDVREIIEAVRYAAVSARYKIYIIDEVHMLSRNAFNALLKTLEEPPPHVKFLFATTEVEKLPVTVLSRCQRFDLRRISSGLLTEHFAGICRAEGVEAEDEALAMIATAAEGSVRDGLSILDQGIAHADLDGEGKVTAAKVRDMLGLADKSLQRKLFGALLAGDGAGLLELVAHQFALGVEPLALIRGTMETVHKITVAQIGARNGEIGMSDAASAEEREAIEGWAKALAAGQLHRLWQLLLKGHEEVRSAPDPLAAAQMALLRVMHAADMPDPGTLAKQLQEIASRPSPVAVEGGAPHAAPTARAAPEWEALVDAMERHSISTAHVMRMQVRVVALAAGVLRYSQPPGFKQDISGELRAGLLAITGDKWVVESCAEEGMPTLVERDEAKRAEQQAALRRSPLVEATFAAFPGAEIIPEEEAGPARGDRNWSRRA